MFQKKVIKVYLFDYKLIMADAFYKMMLSWPFSFFFRDPKEKLPFFVRAMA